MWGLYSNVVEQYVDQTIYQSYQSYLDKELTDVKNNLININKYLTELEAYLESGAYVTNDSLDWHFRRHCPNGWEMGMPCKHD